MRKHHFNRCQTMAMPARGVRSTTNKTPETEPVSQRPRSAQRSPLPNQGNSTAQRLQSLVEESPKVQKLRAIEGLVAEQGNEQTLSLLDRQSVTYKVLIDRFGAEVDLSMELYDKVADGRASEAETIDYIAKADLLTERLKKFYREVDVAKISEISAQDLNVLISMLSTGFAVTQSETKYISKVLPNQAMQSRLSDAIENKPITIAGFIGAAEATESLSPQQTITTLGLDYTNANNGTDFLLQGGTGERTAYEPIPQVSYMKIPYTEQLKRMTKMTLDVRLYEKILERNKRAENPQAPLSQEELAISIMANEIAKAPISLKYRRSNNETPDQETSNIAKYAEKYNRKDIKAADAPFTGLGFSAHGERIGSGFLNMYPEMNIFTQLTKDNYQAILGQDNPIEFYTKFAKTDKELSTLSPDGSTDIKVGTWDGDKVSIPSMAESDYEQNFNRVKGKFGHNSEHTEILNNNKLNLANLKDALGKTRIKPPNS